MPDEHDVLVDLVQALQDQVNELADQVADLNRRSEIFESFDLINNLNRIDQILTGVQKRLDKLEGK